MIAVDCDGMGIASSAQVHCSVSEKSTPIKSFSRSETIRVSSRLLSSVSGTLFGESARRQASQRQNELTNYSNLLINNFQKQCSLNEVEKNAFLEYLMNNWILKLQKNYNTTTVSPVPLDTKEETTVNVAWGNVKECDVDLREELEQVIHSILLKRALPCDDAHCTVFADYDLILKDNGHNKVIVLAQLKSRHSAVKGGGKATDDLSINNPFFTIDTMKDWLILAFWSIYLKQKNHNNSTSRVPDAKSTFRFRRSMTLAKEQSPVMPFQAIADSIKLQRSKGKQENVITLNQKESSLQLSSNDSQKKQALLKYCDIIGLQALKNEFSLSESIRLGGWSNPVKFLSQLEDLEISISIFAIEKDETFFPLIYVNKAWELLTGYDRDEVIGKEIQKLFIGKNTEKDQLNRLLSGVKYGQYLKIGINFLLPPSGSYMYCLLSMIPVHDHCMNYKYIIMHFYDSEKPTGTIDDLKYSNEVLFLISLALRCF